MGPGIIAPEKPIKNELIKIPHKAITHTFDIPGFAFGIAFVKIKTASEIPMLHKQLSKNRV
jgi:hypothetical protein